MTAASGIGEPPVAAPAGPVPSRNSRLLATGLLVLSLLLLGPYPATAGPPVGPGAEEIWAQAEARETAGDRETAATLFLRVYQDYPALPLAEEALWRALQYYRNEVLNGNSQHWRTVEELYRRFAADFPGSSRLEAVYFDMGRLLYRRGNYRQALARFNLLAKRFPESRLLARVLYFQAKCNLHSERLTQAREIFEGYLKSDDPDTRARGLAGLGEAATLEGDFSKGTELLDKAFALSAGFYRNLPEAEALRASGIAALRTGNEEKGRGYLLHYLNVVGVAEDRLDLMLEIAESYHRQGKYDAAQSGYAKIVEEGEPHSRPHLIASFRQAHFFDDPESVLSKWQRRGDLKDPAGDEPYLRLLEQMYETPLAQEARRGLFARYRARDDFAAAFDLARAYLRRLPADGGTAKDQEAAAAMLLYIAEHLTNTGQNRELYELYLGERPQFERYPGGRLLYLAGRAAEGLYLYRQAGELYFQALRLPLDDGDRTDLSYRRVRVYIERREYANADRLLTYLAEVYAGRKELGEVMYLRGLLARQRGDLEASASCFAEAARILTFPDRRSGYAEAHLDVLHQLAVPDRMAPALDSYAEWLAPAERQAWYLRLATLYAERNREDAAGRAAATAVLETMPQDTENAQRAYLLLGDILSRQGAAAESRASYGKAAKGGNELLRQLAEERLRRQEIDAAMSRINIPTQ
ncbi:MAG: tetratricopeptide repeat protein [Thermodesulfobacteriota bacterium]